MKISTTISKLILVALLLMPEFVLAQNQAINVNGSQIQISSTLQAVFDQAESVYIPPGYKIDAVYKDAPDMVPLFLGLIMQRQEIYMNQIRNVNHLKNNTSLHDEIATFIGQLAKAHNYINPIDKSKLSPITMHESFMEALKGKYNSLYKNKFGINPTTADITYLLDRAPNSNNVGEHAKVDLQKDEPPTEINLFGEVSPAAKSSEDKPYKKKKNPGKNHVFQVSDKYGAPWVGECICPDTNPSKDFRSARYKTKSPTGVGWVSCNYDKKGRLSYQSPVKTLAGVSHGMRYSYQTDDGVYYLKFVEPVVHGKLHGEKHSYALSKQKQPYLEHFINHENGYKTSHKIWKLDKNGNRYLHTDIHYFNQGKDWDEEVYSGLPRNHFLYKIAQYRGGVRTYSEEREENGRVRERIGTKR